MWGLCCSGLILLYGKVWVPPSEYPRQFVVQRLDLRLERQMHPFSDHCICWRLQKRLLMTWFMVDSTNLVLIRSPQRHRSPLLRSLYR